MSHTRETNRVGKLIKPALIACHRAEVVLESLHHSVKKLGVDKKHIERHFNVLSHIHKDIQELHKRLIKTDEYKQGKKVLRPKMIYQIKDEVSNFLFSTRLVAFESNSHTTSSSHRTHHLRRT